ncbi:metallophosphoesterase family protein [Amycolatopsis taiwanensis]|uniref:3',5'-cyclic adenosine monophosphate phosphodiesterase CpdA n=1 Tax=Amycolatopsis taiwanensis TaxID=342230 RepID=A0A9W6VGU4_9PSEU|nr:metallophosphoesterase [Amycolatopsis taiwanensis]GLY71183.1 3',5'-cyclic adenosine monophosphate phosphodiesterase CpdA [Amycolatopsis taiwanensis]
MSVTLLHLSDPHLTEDPASALRLRQVLDLPPSRRPDAIVVTGDVADHGQPREYQAFTAAMTAGIPWIAVPGNHDNPEILRRELRQDRSPVIEVGPLRVIGLDVTVPGEDHGFLDEDTARLVAARARGAHQVALALHQPPVRTGHAVADAMLLTNPEALIDLVRRIPPVVAILCGHVHTALASSLAGTPVLGAPGIASTLTLDPDRRPITMPDCPPGLALHHIDDDGSITTTFHHRA